MKECRTILYPKRHENEPKGTVPTSKLSPLLYCFLNAYDPLTRNKIKRSEYVVSLDLIYQFIDVQYLPLFGLLPLIH